MATLFKKIYTGTLAKYTAADKDENSLYLVQDETTGVKSMYKGATKVGGDFIVVNGDKPAQPEKGVIYYITAFTDQEGQGSTFAGFYDGEKWVPLSNSGTIEGINGEITSLKDRVSATEASIATLNGEGEGSVKKAVADTKAAIEGELVEGDAKTLKAINDELDALDAKTSVVDGDMILAQTEDGIASALTIAYNDSKIQLLGNNNALVSEISAADFIKDGMIESVAYDDETHEVTITWNTDGGKEPTVVDLSGLVDVYTGKQDEIVVEGGVISLAEAVTNAIAASLNSISVSTENVDDFVELSVSEKADKTQEVGVTVTYGTFAEDDGTDGIAKVSAVKTELDTLKAALADKNVEADGDEYVEAAAEANKVTVSASAKTKASLALADSAVQSIAVADAGQEVTVANTDTAFTIGVTKATYGVVEGLGNDTLTDAGLVDGKMVKDYVADNAVYWETL